MISIDAFDVLRGMVLYFFTITRSWSHSDSYLWGFVNNLRQVNKNEVKEQIFAQRCTEPDLTELK